MTNEAHDIILPPEFSGEGQLVLYTRYGDPRATGWSLKWITNWDVQKYYPWFPMPQIEVHKHFWPILEEAFGELGDKGLHTEIKTCDNCYELRNIRGSNSVLSVHSWGAAIDLNAADNPTGGTGTWSNEFIDVMKRHNLFCGQNWKDRKEPMHFAMVNG